MTDLEDGTYTVVVDSIEDGFATVFFEADGEEVGSDVVEADVVPEAGRHADAILTVTVESGEFGEWSYDEAETEERQEDAQRRFDQLSQRPPADDDH